MQFYVLFPSGKNPSLWSRIHETLTRPLHTILSNNSFRACWIIQPTDRQTDGRTDRPCRITSAFFGEGDKQECCACAGWPVQNTCTLKEHKFFDTHFSRNEANRLARYLYFLPYETHVIVLTLGEAFSNMTDSAYEEFDNLGVEIGDMVQVGHTLVSLIVVGSHCNTMYELYEEEPAYLYFQLNGMCNVCVRVCGCIKPRSGLWCRITVWN